MPSRRPSRPALLAFLVFVFIGVQARASRVGLVVGEPFGSFGTMLPQGHASLYLADFCQDTPVHLRPCTPDEPGVVLSRHHDLRYPALDWMAIPLRTFFYGSEDVSTVPAFMNAKLEAEIREHYRLEHLRAFVPDRIDRHGHAHSPPSGDWVESIGAAFDRRLLLYTFEVPEATEAAIAERLNSQPNKRRYTLTRDNCADFAAELLAMALPEHTFHRNLLADFNITTPKNLARQLDTYGHAHPELRLQVYAIPQIPGSLRRSRPLLGGLETLVTEKRYTVAIAMLQPELLPVIWIVYKKKGEWPYGYDAIPLTPAELSRFVKPCAKPDLGATADRLLPLPLPAPPPTGSASGQSSTN